MEAEYLPTSVCICGQWATVHLPDCPVTIRYREGCRAMREAVGHVTHAPPTSVGEAVALLRLAATRSDNDYLVEPCIVRLIASVRAEERERLTKAAREAAALAVDSAISNTRSSTLAEVREIARNVATKRLCTVGRTSLDRSTSAFLADLEAALDCLAGLAKMEAK